ncbi:MAG TPA: diguanylate cyclase [Thermoanaerobaculia bacterium]
MGTPAADPRSLEVLNQVARIATLDLELRPMLQRITDTLAERFGWEFVALISLDLQRGAFRCEALSTSAETSVYVGYGREIGSGVVGEVASTGRPVLIDDVREWPNYVETMPGARSELCVPVKHHGHIVALLNLESRHPGAFRGQLELLETVADQIAGAIASAQLFDELRQRARLMEMMSEVSRTALEATDLQQLLDRVTQYIRERFPQLSVSIVRQPVRSRGPSHYVIPIRFQDQFLGTLDLESASPDVFTPANVLAFEAFADQIAGAFHMAAVNERLEETTRHLASAIETLHRISTEDSLTGLFNRRHFDEALAIEWRRAARSRSTLSLLMVDIDYFKPFNDTAGHQAGDECLRRVAETLLACVQRAGDLVARYGGEEFAVLLPETDAGHALQIAHRLRERIEALELAHPASPLGHVTISAGVASVVPPRDGSGSGDFVRVADAALYDAKRQGRNRVAS